jgi:hypothetical protein
MRGTNVIQNSGENAVIYFVQIISLSTKDNTRWCAAYYFDNLYFWKGY